MTIHTASLPAHEGRGQDRWAAVTNGLIVLDGASSFTPAVINAERFVDELIADLSQRLPADQESLCVILGRSINAVASKLQLKPGHSPSSTVLILRKSSENIDLLLLGDSTALVKTTYHDEPHRITDTRLAAVAPEYHDKYRSRLRTGSGYDNTHRALLRSLQEEQLAARNTPGGYWIAEADPSAAEHAIVQSFPIDTVEWCILATDGAQRPVDHLGIPWERIAEMTDDQLAEQLQELQEWESRNDPSGALLPRAKVHDDKLIAVWKPCRVTHRQRP
ncbi:protein phosphatase 2C domain-containing protein [Gandjariella thermophila]|nr:protein phosphatase 2C domain-containing protein [Gandjariella thermophila]